MSPATAQEQKKLTVKVLAPTSTLYDGLAVSVTAKNKIGTFDILVDHANFFSLLSPSNVVVDTGRDKVTFSVTQGLLKVHDNHVTLFIDLQTASFS